MKEYVLYVNEASNPPNVPQPMPIEKCWGCLVQKVDLGRWGDTTEKLLIRRIKSKLKAINSTIKTIIARVKTKVRSNADNDVFSGYKKNIFE